MRVGLIIPGTLWDGPFVRIYADILTNMGVGYDIISWNRDGKDKPEGIQYDYIQPLNSSAIAKIIGFLRFARFVKKTVRKHNYDKLIVFCPQIGIFITSLLKKYNGRYIFDYRDLSIEQKSVFKHHFNKVLKYSYANVISSPGFKKTLPSGYNYLICHNFNVEVVKEAIELPIEGNWHISNPKVLLTIGSIRDYSSNSEVIRCLANNSEYLMRFVGRGISAEALENYSKELSVGNIEFTGFYPKEDEPNYIEESTFMNIFYPRRLSHDTALSNRFYNSLIYKRPMLVTKNTTQGDYSEKYKVGVAVDTCENLDVKLKSFLKNDYADYAQRCNQLLQIFLEEQKHFLDTLDSFIKS